MNLDQIEEDASNGITPHYSDAQEMCALIRKQDKHIAEMSNLLVVSEAANGAKQAEIDRLKFELHEATDSLVARMAAQTGAPAVTVDTPEFNGIDSHEFRNALWDVVQCGKEHHDQYIKVLIAHIDAHTAAVAAKAAKDKDGNHVDDLRSWLDEAREQYEAQDVAFHACALKLKQAEADILALRAAAPQQHAQAALSDESVPNVQEIVTQLEAAVGGTICPLCGKDYPHGHSPSEITIYRNGCRYGAIQQKRAGANDQSSSEDARFYAEATSGGGRTRTDKHHEYRIGEAGGQRLDSGGDGACAGLPCGGEVREVVASHQPAAAPSSHADDIAVDLFAVAMKEKMAASRAKGRGGWDNPADCLVQDLATMLVDHLEKGDPVDIGNFCMMIWNRMQSGYTLGEFDIITAAINRRPAAAPAIQQEGAALDDRLSLYDVALTDEDIVQALHSLAIDTFPSKFGFPEIQVSGTNVPGIRRIVARCNRIIAEKDGPGRAALAAPSPAQREQK